MSLKQSKNIKIIFKCVENRKTTRKKETKIWKNVENITKLQ